MKKLAEATFKVTGEGMECTATAILWKDETPHYGNGTCTQITWSYGNTHHYDTRYVKGLTAERFGSFAKDFIRGEIRDTFTIEEV